METTLTVDAIQLALTGNGTNGREYFFMDSAALAIVEEATKRGYIRRISHTQAEWTDEGLLKARNELAAIPTSVTHKKMPAWLGRFTYPACFTYSDKRIDTGDGNYKDLGRLYFSPLRLELEPGIDKVKYAEAIRIMELELKEATENIAKPIYTTGSGQRYYADLDAPDFHTPLAKLFIK